MDCKTCRENTKHTYPHVNPNTIEGVRQYDIDYLYALSRESIKKLWAVIVILGVICIGLLGWAIYASTITTEVTIESSEAYTDDGGTAVANQNGEVRIYNDIRENYQKDR